MDWHIRRMSESKGFVARRITYECVALNRILYGVSYTQQFITHNGNMIIRVIPFESVIK